jgi:hypothetical protein
MNGDRYVIATRDRFERPRDPRRWYRCRCGRWHGINKRYLCHCGAFPPSDPVSAERQEREDRRYAQVLENLGHHEWAALVRGFLP